MRWLEGELPGLVADGLISADTAARLKERYKAAETHSNLGFILLATVGSALVGAGIILLVAHNWDDLSRPLRTFIAFLPLLVALALGLFVLLRRVDATAWRESVAILDIAAVGAAISLVSQIFQIQGSLTDFLLVWTLLSLPIVYLLQSTAAAAGYIAGITWWLVEKADWWPQRTNGAMLYWLLLALVIPFYLGALRRNRSGPVFKFLSVILIVSLTVAVGVTSSLTKTGLGNVAYAGFFTAVYLWGIYLSDDDHLNAVSLLGGIGIGVTAIVLTFEDIWRFRSNDFWDKLGTERWIALTIQLLWPLLAVLLAGWIYWRRKEFPYAITAAVLPLVAMACWLCANFAPVAEYASKTPFSLGGAALMNVFTLALGVELLVRGIRAGSITRANFGLAVIAVLALCRFFDSDLSFVARGLGFIAVGAGFLIANIIFFRKRVSA